MTPTFRPGALNSGSHVPLFEQLANTLRSAIQAGDFDPGEALPSEGDLARKMHVSRPTVREGIDILVREGLLSKRRGQPTIVTLPEPVQHITGRRYQESLDRLHAGIEEPSSAFVRDHGIEWPPNIKASYAEVEANENEREHLRLSHDVRVLRRTLIKMARGKAVRLQYSSYPLALVEGTPVADPDSQPWIEGSEGELFSLGVELRGGLVSEKITARPRTGWEREVLDLGASPWVFNVERVFSDAEGRPVEYSVVVVSASGYAFVFETRLH